MLVRDDRMRTLGARDRFNAIGVVAAHRSVAWKPAVLPHGRVSGKGSASSRAGVAEELRAAERETSQRIVCACHRLALVNVDDCC